MKVELFQRGIHTQVRINGTVVPNLQHFEFDEGGQMHLIFTPDEVVDHRPRSENFIDEVTAVDKILDEANKEDEE